MKRIVRDEVVYSDVVAIADDKGNKITYRGLAEEAEKLGEHMEERSVVFFMCDHQMETVKLLYQILHLNRVPLLLSSDIEESLLEELINVYEPQYIYCKKEHEMGNMYRHVLEFEKHVLLGTEKLKYPVHPDLALLLSTSGTTGSTKLVRLSYENLFDNMEQISMKLGIEIGQKGLCSLPLNYTFGFSFCLKHWQRGATVLVTEEPVISSCFREFYERERVNNFEATPYIYKMMQKVQFWNHEKTEYLHYALTGGERLHKEDMESLNFIMDGKLWNGYGQTECTCGITIINLRDSKAKDGSVGKVYNRMEAAVEAGTNELVIKSKSVCMGYANHRGDLAEGDVNHGILHTGDMAYVDDEGYVYLKGRLDRYIKVLGKRISLDDIEKYLDGVFIGMEFACKGSDDSISVFYSGKRDGFKEGIPVLLDRNMKIPQKFVHCTYLEEIPRNKRGKIMYADLRE